MSVRGPLLAQDDPTVYPEEERVGEDIIQRWIIELLRPLIERWLASRGELGFVGADQFVYFKQFDAHERVAPDVYVLPGVEPTRPVRSWKTWETGIAPSFALEVASSNWEKDYFDVVDKYGSLGVRELIVFDPYYTRHRDGVRWQRFTQVSGGFRQVEWTNEDRVFSSVLGCWLRATGEAEHVRLRLSTGAHGDELFPTGEEAERQAKEVERQAKEVERQAKEVERQAKEVERQAKELERAAKEAALARIVELEAELKRRG